MVKLCKACGLLFVDPQPSLAILRKHYPSDDYYAYISQERKDFFGILRDYLIVHYYSPTMLSRVLAALTGNVPAIPSYTGNGKILDIGCGVGDTLFMLKKLGWNCFGLDIDSRAVSIGRRRGLTNVSVGTYKDVAKYPDKFFDAIRLYHVIEHLDNPDLCLRLVSKKLKPGGELLIGTPNGESVASKLFGKYWYNLDVPRHLMIFSPSSLQVLVERTGFQVREIQYCSAGGIVGSMQYLLSSLIKTKISLLDKLLVVMALYPLERILDKFGKGDIFVLRATCDLLLP